MTNKTVWQNLPLLNDKALQDINEWASSEEQFISEVLKIAELEAREFLEAKKLERLEDNGF